MSETTSQAQQSEFFKKMVGEQVTRTASMFEEMGKLEAKGVEQARRAVEEAGKLAEETLGYTTSLTAEWRRLSLEAVRKAAYFWSMKA